MAGRLRMCVSAGTRLRCRTSLRLPTTETADAANAAVFWTAAAAALSARRTVPGWQAKACAGAGSGALLKGLGDMLKWLKGWSNSS